MNQTLLITGGAGFIGSALIRHIIDETHYSVVNVDKLTYAASIDSLAEVAESPRYHFEQVDICDEDELRRIFAEYRPQAVLHLAAESHVDRSIAGPAEFVRTNVAGTVSLLEAARAYWEATKDSRIVASKSPRTSGRGFRFVHVSTDEVYGELGDKGLFAPGLPYEPHSPYAASKASGDHFVRAWERTYGLPVLVTNGCNNYGQWQHEEKLIPTVISRAMRRDSIPVYGRGENVREWIFVEDHVRALMAVMLRGKVGATYLIGSGAERTNLEVVQEICRILDNERRLDQQRDGWQHESLIEFVEDRPGHDWRYALDSSRLMKELNWRPQVNFKEGLERTVKWYLRKGLPNI